MVNPVNEFWVTYIDVWINADEKKGTKAEEDRLRHWYKIWVQTETGKKSTRLMAMERGLIPPHRSDLWLLVSGDSGNEVEGYADAAREFFESAGYDTGMDLPTCHPDIPSTRVL
ncbi:hypothetical protein PWT90_10573 [Aphanocladium album]|nr:hypothetical protein PWT90_10573 [Aphanocladium album]